MLIYALSINANATGVAYRLTYNEMKTDATLIYADVCELEGYHEDETRILLGGALTFYDVYYAFPELLRYEHMGMPFFWSGQYGCTTCGRGFFLNYPGVDTGNISAQEFYDIVQSEEYSEMPLWPEAGSVKIINDIAVVKINEHPEN